MNPYIQSLRRAKFEIYTLIGRKMLRYALTCLTRYIRLGKYIDISKCHYD